MKQSKPERRRPTLIDQGREACQAVLDWVDGLLNPPKPVPVRVRKKTDRR